MKVWFITGASRGFGRLWAEAALRRGDKVAGTARNLTTLEPLVSEFGASFLPLQLDVTDRDAAFAAVKAAHDYFGRLDVVVNNAGFGHFGMVEEATEAEMRGQIETNVYGALWVTQAALPYMRAQHSGHIIQVSSISGITAFPMLGIYNASKFALEGMSQALALEVADFGIRVSIVEPGPFGTDWSGSSAVQSEPMEAYAAYRAQVQAARAERAKTILGDPKNTVTPILTLVDAENPPLRMFLGENMFKEAVADYGKRLTEWAQWQPVAALATRPNG